MCDVLNKNSFASLARSEWWEPFEPESQLLGHEMLFASAEKPFEWLETLFPYSLYSWYKLNLILIKHLVLLPVNQCIFGFRVPGNIPNIRGCGCSPVWRLGFVSDATSPLTSMIWVIGWIGDVCMLSHNNINAINYIDNENTKGDRHERAANLARTMYLVFEGNL